MFPEMFCSICTFFQTKERLMQITCKGEHRSTSKSDLQFYADLSQYTLQLSRNLNTITRALRNHSISYRWGFLTKLIVNKEGSTHVITSPEKGFRLLQYWQILPDESPSFSPSRSPNSIPREWKQMNDT